MITYTTNEFGLRQKDMDYMIRLFVGMPAIEKVVLFGSRSKGTFEKGSDVDIAVQGPVSDRDVARLHFLLENESPTLLWFDVVHYDTLKNSAKKAEIDLNGKVIFER